MAKLKSGVFMMALLSKSFLAFVDKAGLPKFVHEGIKSFQCILCTDNFSTKAGLDRHISTVHEKKKQFKCDICDSSFVCKIGLIRHTQRIHEKKKDFKCYICNTSFGSKYSMKHHVSSIHYGEKHECNICGLKSYSKSNLNSHLLIHETKKGV